jgi:hemerythrin superfamily protein
MKVTVLLRNDHDAIRALVARHQKAGGRDPNQRRVALDQIRRGILIHDQMEEEIFHPALISPAGEQVESAKAEHQNIATLLHELDEMAPHDRNFEAKLDELL